MTVGLRGGTVAVLSVGGRPAAMKKKTSFKFSEEAARQLDELAKLYGIPKTSVLEMLVRDRVRAEQAKKGNYR